jgi:hypothetical protein
MKAIYPEKKKYSKYDGTHYLCYVNEMREEFTPNGMDSETEANPVLGYAYEGNMEDGGTLIEAKDATYGEFVNGLIRVKYSTDSVEAIMANQMVAIANPEHEKANGYTTDWKEYQSFREKCKETAKMLLSE